MEKYISCTTTYVLYNILPLFPRISPCIKYFFEIRTRACTLFHAHLDITRFFPVYIFFVIKCNGNIYCIQYTTGTE